jgi:phosphorylcholine metabolism protein LicD
MGHNIDFFRDEVRNGFYIPTVIKQAWASSLDVLGEIDRICKKYGIRYYADWGTFLGAVRHGGFVPWDDDLDICMRRDDYEKFRKVCDKELPKHYTIHDYERKSDHWLFLARVVGNSTICYDEEYLKNHYNFPWLSPVDIFLKDYLYSDYEQEKARDKEIMFLITLADGIRENSFERQTIVYHLYDIKTKYHTTLPDLPDLADTDKINKLCIALYHLAEKEMAKVCPEESYRIGQIFPWVLKGNKGEPKEYYDKIIYLPFEDTTMPVPAYYHTVLSGRYGNYNEIHKVWDGHTYPFFEGQKANLEEVNGAPLYSFIFYEKMLERPEVDRSNSLKVIAKECLKELQRLLEEFESNPEERLAACQQLAIDFGTLIEQVKGEDRECTKAVVSELEKFCETIYQCFQDIERIGTSSNGNNSRGSVSIGQVYGKLLSESLNKVCNAVETYIIQRKEILFLPIGYREWRGFETVYKDYFNVQSKVVSKETEIKDVVNNCISEYDIYVVPLPLLTKDPLGQVEVSEEKLREGLQIEHYPADIIYSDWQTYDVSQHCPDVIYIQNPYDTENPYLTVPPQYYASNLRKYTDKLVFIPFKDTGEFGEKDGTDLYNLNHYAAAPGVIYADEVIVQSENIKNHYVDALINLVKASKDDLEISLREYYRDVWQKKIKARASQIDTGIVSVTFIATNNDEKYVENTDNRTIEEKALHKKRLIYCIGANELSEHKNSLIDDVNKRFEIFRKNKDRIEITIVLYPDDRQQWLNVDQTLSKRIFDLIDTGVSERLFNILRLFPKDADDVAAEYDAYYGDSSPLVPAFITQKKPVMIANYDCL